MKNLLQFPLRILGTGSYFPKQVVTNFDLKKYNPTVGSNEWIIKNLGIETRHKASLKEPSSYLGYQSALAALTNANMNIDEIDLIITNTSSPDRISPSTATIIQEQLSCKRNIPSFDINAVCSGFLYNLDIASQMLDKYKNILLISTETYSKFTDYSHRNSVFFGDGAASVVITKGSTGWYNGSIYSNGLGKEHFTVKMGQTFQMNGSEVFRTATKVLPEAINTCLEQNNLTIADIDFFVPHQPSYKILHKTADEIGLDRSKICTNMQHKANTAGASIPTVLDHLLKTSNIPNDSKILFAAVGSGWTWGAGILNFEK